MIKVVDQFEAMIILRRDRFQLIVIAVEGIALRLPQAMISMLVSVCRWSTVLKCSFGIRQLNTSSPALTTQPPFSATKAISWALREEGDQLVILVAAGDDEANALLAHPLILGEEALTVIGFGIAQKGAVHVYRNQFDAH
jgi:hypothetical protein